MASRSTLSGGGPYGQKVGYRRVWMFILFACGIAWLAALAIALTGGIASSPVIAPGLGLTLPTVLLTVFYMPAPALANVLTQIVTSEGWSNSWLRPRFKSGWRYWLAIWLLVPRFTLCGVAVYYLRFPSQFDPGLNRIPVLLPPGAALMNLWLVVAAQALQGIFLSVVINSPIAFGEEFGWRTYLLQKLLPLGPRRAVLLSGAVAGVWHWPAIAMGYNYRLDYPSFLLLGMLVMVWFTLILAVLFSWAVLRAGSVRPAVIRLAVLNGLGATGILVASGDVYLLLGPISASIIGSLAFTVFALWALLSRHALPPIMSPGTSAS